MDKMAMKILDQQKQSKEFFREVDTGGIKYISFDIFDTLVFRNVSEPSKVFEIIEKKLTDKDIILKHGFKKVRIQAECKARNKSSYEEITLSEIYNEMSEIDGRVKKRLQAFEIEVETAMCVPNFEMVDIYYHFKKKGYKIILISDMYLTKDNIKVLLNKCGITGYERIYVSSDYRKTKRSGNLFNIVKHDLKIKPREWMHIGDNYVSDYKRPQFFGIRSILYKRNKEKLKYFLSNSESIDYDVLHTSIQNIQVKMDQYKRIGYEVLGPMILGYLLFIKRKYDYKNLDKIYFLAREGKILKECFHILFPSIETDYLYVSRLAVCRSMLIDTKSYNDMRNVMKSLLRGVNTIGQFATLIGLSKDIIDDLKREGFDADTSLDSVTDENGLYNCIMKYGSDIFLEYKSTFIIYTEELRDKNKNIAVCDVGWSGTMQIMLQRITNRSIVGIYFGVSDLNLDAEFLISERYGYLFQADDINERLHMTRFTAQLFETLFLCKDGSTIGYNKVNNKTILPIMEKNESSREFNTIRKQIQNAAIEFLNNVQRSGLLSVINDINPEDAFCGYKKFAVYPTKDTMNLCSKVNYLDGAVRSMLPQKTIFWYFLHFNRLKTDFSESSCKLLWLKGLMRIKFPYYKLLKLLAIQWGMKTTYQKKNFLL